MVITLVRSGGARHGRDAGRGAARSTNLPEEEKAKWVNGLPNIIEPWLEQTGEAGKTVLKAYFAALRERGATPTARTGTKVF